MISERIANLKTISEVFVARTEESAEEIAYEHEVNGAWEAVTWREYGEFVQYAMLGLKTIGFKFGERVAVWGETMPQWTVIDLATMAAGGCTAGIYQTCTPDQASYIINDSGATLVAVDDIGRLEQALSVRDKTPAVRYYVTWGAGEDESRNIYSLDTLAARGKAYAQDHPKAYEESVASLGPETTAVLVYTSGTTGPPKGAMLSHKNCLFCCKAMHERISLGGESTSVSFLPLSHVAEHVVGFFNRLYSGGTAYFMPDMTRFSEVAQAKGPTILGAVPRLYEKAYGAIMQRAESASPARRALFNWAIRTGASVAQHRIQGNPVPLAKAAMHKVADKLVLSKVRMALGGRVQFMICGAAPIASEIIDFFNAAGLPFLEVYGMTESSGVSHMNYIGRYKSGTVGTTLPGFECKIAEDGEILVRGDGVFQGYLNMPEETAAAIDPEGWLHTGDIGEIDDEGFLRITDRKKNLLITAGGKNIAPSNIELLINREPIISQVLVIGDKRKFLSALITISTEELEVLRQGPEFSGLSLEELIEGELIAERVRSAVDRANEELARYENIRRYKVLPREFTSEDSEMTPTMKLKRKVIEQNYADVIEAFYEEPVA